MLFSLFLLGSPSLSKANKNKQQILLILTPYPKFITQTYRSSFKKLYPDIELEVIKKGTNDAVEYLLDNKDENIVDIFWASSPESFKRLKAGNTLLTYSANTRAIPKVISGVQISDTNNTYTGYALSGYGFMWNTHYLKIKDLPIPHNWENLGESKYFGHIAMSTPSNSGTTHISVESILQTRGWDNGWKLVKAIAANSKDLSKRSVHVPKKVQKGESGIGIVIDYYGLSSKAQSYPVNFAYSQPVILLPASAAIINNAPNPDAAKKFINFLVSPQGQSLLLDKKSRRIPILPATFDEAPADYPNPYEDEDLAETFDFDIELSVKRYDLVNEMFDAVITNNFDQFSQAAKQTLKLEHALKNNNNEQASQLLTQAKTALMWMPNINSSKAQSDTFLTAFNQSRDTKASFPKTWATEAKQQYQAAIKLAKEGLLLLDKS